MNIGDIVKYHGKPSYGEFMIVSISVKHEDDYSVLGLVDSAGTFFHENENFVYLHLKGNGNCVSALKRMYLRYLEIGREDLAEKMLAQYPEFIDLI